MSLYINEVIVAIEKIVEQQVEASGITGELHRLDGEKIVDAIMEQLEGFALVPKEQTKKMLASVHEAGFFYGNRAPTTVYKLMIEAAQEQSHE
jgi:hypothetical protein